MTNFPDNEDLIAAAPDLLDALECYLSLDYNGFAIDSGGALTTPEMWVHEREETREKAIAAIARARGAVKRTWNGLELLDALIKTRGIASSLEAGDPVCPDELRAVWQAGDIAIAKALKPGDR